MEKLVAYFVEQGMSPENARAAADRLMRGEFRREMGDVSTVPAQAADRMGMRAMLAMADQRARRQRVEQDADGNWVVARPRPVEVVEMAPPPPATVSDVMRSEFGATPAPRPTIPRTTYPPVQTAGGPRGVMVDLRPPPSDPMEMYRRYLEREAFKR